MFLTFKGGDVQSQKKSSSLCEKYYCGSSIANLWDTSETTMRWSQTHSIWYIWFGSKLAENISFDTCYTPRATWKLREDMQNHKYPADARTEKY